MYLSPMALLDSVHEQAAQILLNYAEIPMIMLNINRLIFSVCVYETES